jgi:hypothetical protein
MPTQDLISRWEDGLAQALSPTEGDELPAGDLEMAAGVVIRSRIRASGDGWADTDYHGSFGCLFSACC